jgi:predicted DCC family thiol-disulfide oxidoreductase YuxK
MGEQKTKTVSRHDTVFYDGHCGLCHRSVRFLVWADGDGSRFRFAPLQGDLFLAAIPEAEREALPDSLVLRTAAGNVFVRSAAVLHVLRRLGPGWRALAIVAGWLPRGLLDGVYDFIARIRYRLFPRPVDACPIVPKHLRARFHM